MNATNNQPKVAKKLTLNKESIHQLTSTETANKYFGFTLNCTYTC